MPNTVELIDVYNELICEAFVKPIRNVTVIDDEYPTLYGFLEHQLNQDRAEGERVDSLKSKQLKSENIDRLKSILRMCHNTHKWSVDVYDGQAPRIGDKLEFPEHLNHSDLLILDYHLDGEPGTDNGDRARNIIDNLVRNNHFNLIVIHTKGHENDIDKVFEEVLQGLYKKPTFSTEYLDAFDDIESWLDEPESDEARLFLELKPRFIELAGFLKSNLNIYNYNENNHIFHGFEKEINYVASKVGVTEKHVVAWKFSDSLTHVNDDLLSDIEWFFDRSVNFISTGKAFITVVKKSDEEPVELLYDKLTEALFKHNPPPIMLLLAKIRHELDERGLEQANDIINDQLAQSGWLIDMYNSQHDDDFKHLGAINRHWEQLSTASKGPLIDFSKRMYAAIRSKAENKNAATQLFFPEYSNDELSQIKHLNAYICSYPINGSHINTGTVFELTAGEDQQFWVCLSPACDLVPNQAKKRWGERLGDNHSAFQAVRLFEDPISSSDGNEKKKKFKKKINQNEHIFIRYGQGIKTFRFTKDESSNPEWETFYALNHGNYFEGNILKIQHLRSMLDDQNDPESTASLKLSDVKDVKAIASLRYEYGLNLLQKLGGNQSRVGLDFISAL